MEYWGNIGIMENKMETTIMVSGFRVGQCFLHHTVDGGTLAPP